MFHLGEVVTATIKCHSRIVHSDIVATFPGKKYILIFYYIQVGYSGQRGGPRWPLYRPRCYINHKYTLHCCLAVDQHPRNMGIWVEGTFPLGVSRVGMGSGAYSGSY